MILSTKISSNNLDMAWIVPIYSNIKPEVSKGDIDIFYTLSGLFAKRRKGWLIGALRARSKVEVVEEKKVDIYDIAILRASNASMLIEWLNNHGYFISAKARDVLQDYCTKPNIYFIANKINLTNKYNVTIGEAEITCVEGLFPRGLVTSKWEIEYKLDHAKETAYCKNASMQAVKALIELREGIATHEDRCLFELNSYIKEVYRQYMNRDARYATLLTYNGSLSNLSEDAVFANTSFLPQLDPNYVSLWEMLSYLASVFPIVLVLITNIIMIIVLSSFWLLHL